MNEQTIAQFQDMAQKNYDEILALRASADPKEIFVLGARFGYLVGINDSAQAFGEAINRLIEQVQR